jgi:hypothetical protein
VGNVRRAGQVAHAAGAARAAAVDQESPGRIGEIAAFIPRGGSLEHLDCRPFPWRALNANVKGQQRHA